MATYTDPRFDKLTKLPARVGVAFVKGAGFCAGRVAEQRKRGTLVESPAKGAKGGRVPRLCLRDSIRDADPAVQRLLRAVEEASSLPALILTTGQVARLLAVHMVEAVRTERARWPTAWPPWPAWGITLRRKGCAPRQMLSLWGPIRWHRRVGRWPQGGASPQVAPLESALGGQPPQRTSDDLQALGWAVAVFVPCATAARWLGWDWGSVVRSRAVWGWGQAAGHQALECLPADLAPSAQGHEPLPEPLAAAPAAVR
jgi:hypothetical protein